MLTQEFLNAPICDLPERRWSDLAQLKSEEWITHQVANKLEVSDFVLQSDSEGVVPIIEECLTLRSLMMSGDLCSFFFAQDAQVFLIFFSKVLGCSFQMFCFAEGFSGLPSTSVQIFNKNGLYSKKDMHNLKSWF